MTHLFKMVVFEAFEIAYITCFLPIKFVKSTLISPNEEVYINQTAVLVTGLFTLSMLMIVKAAYNLQRRGQEMQFNAKMSGKWLKIPQPTEIIVKRQEWRQGTNYAQGSIVSMEKNESTLTNVGGTGEDISSQLDYYMAVGNRGNRSQPDDYLSQVMYSLFSQPLQTLFKLQVASIILITIFLVYVMQMNVGS